MCDHGFKMLASLSEDKENRLTDDEKAAIIAERETTLTPVERVAQRLALEAGQTNDFCPRCDRLFLAFQDSSVVRSCSVKPCYYSMSDLERKGLVEGIEPLTPLKPCKTCDSKEHTTENCPGL